MPLEKRVGDAIPLLLLKSAVETFSNLSRRFARFGLLWRRIRNSRTARQLVGFGLAGGASLAVDLLIFNFLLMLDAHKSLSSFVSATMGLTLNFFLNKRTFLPRLEVFKGAGSSGIKFVFVALSSYGILIFGFELYLFSFPDASNSSLNLARVGLVAVGSALRFMLYRLWVFKLPARVQE